MKKILAFLLLIIILSPNILLSSPATVTIRAPAVKKMEGGYEGALSYITVAAEEGTGRVFMDTWPLTDIDMQGSTRLAVNVACEVSGRDPSAYDFYITFRSDSPVIGGPSAGASMTVALIAVLEGWKLRDDVMMTGMINPDGSVGPIGGVLEKAQVASESGMRLFLIPEGQRIVTVQETQTKTVGPLVISIPTYRKVDAVEHAKETWGLEVREVYDIWDAVFLFTGHTLPSPEKGQGTPDTYPMRPFAEKELEKASLMLSQTENELDSYQGGYKRDFADILAEGDASIASAREDFKGKKFFSSLSNSFKAETSIIFAKNLLGFVDSEDPTIVSTLYEETRKRYEEMRREELAEEFQGVSYLQCMATSQLKMNEASDMLSQAEKYLEKKSYIDAIYYLSLASSSLQYSAFWAEMAPNFSGGATIPSSKVQTVADTMIANAELSYVYASKLLGTSRILTQAGQLIDKSQREFERGEYAASLFDAIQARVYANTSVEMLVSGEEVLVQRLESARSDAADAIAISRAHGIEPILASSYFELAANEADTLASMVYYKYAHDVGHIFKYIEASPTVSPSSPSSLSLVPSQTPPLALADALAPSGNVQILFLSLGVFLGGILMGFLLGTRHK